MQYKCYGVQFTEYGLKDLAMSECEARVMLEEAYAGLGAALTKKDADTGMVLHVNPMTDRCISLTKLSGGDWLIGEYEGYAEPKMLAFGFLTEVLAEPTKH